MQSFPPDPITNYGISVLKDGIEPQITYTSPDGELIFYLHGALAPFPGVTEGVVLAEGPSGLQPPFKHLWQKGARQDGSTWTDTVHDPGEINMKVKATARTRDRLRYVIRKWMQAWDPKQPGTLSWVTPDGGQWWCNVRLHGPAPEKLDYFPNVRDQEFTWWMTNDNAFWMGTDSTSQFQVYQTDSVDKFGRVDLASLGSNWAQVYSAGASGACGTDGSSALWTPSGTASASVVNRWLGASAVQTIYVYGSPTSWTLTYNDETTDPLDTPTDPGTIQAALNAIGLGGVSVVGLDGGPYTVTFGDAQPVGALTGTASGGTDSYVTVAQTGTGMAPVTSTDNQTVSAQFGIFYTWPFNDGAYVDLWGRMDSTGTSGIRARIGVGELILSRFNAGAETVMASQLMVLTPFAFETFSLVLGTSTNAREYQVLRDGFPILDFVEVGAASNLGPDYRGAGFGMTAGRQENLFTGAWSQASPPTVANWSMADNVAIGQSGLMPLTNFGDQEEYPDFLVYGPGTFSFGDGPGVAPTITFGPLADNQIALIRTNPLYRAVYDLSIDTSQQVLTGFQSFVEQLFGLAFNSNIPPLVSWFESLFGITPQQGNMYSLLNGRWSTGIPPKPLSGPATSEWSVEIDGGNANSKIIAAITPRRRWPD